ncbi:MAG: hypothetical protein H6817_01815 [Phycisphaerales bacterium]|nr:hypothetical protein [Phycisphaerales bacterium]
MTNRTRMSLCVFTMIAMAWMAGPAVGQGTMQDPDAALVSRPYDFQLHADDAAPSTRLAQYEPSFLPQGDDDAMGGGDETDEMNWDLAGPYEMRSADPEPNGVVEMKNIFGWSTTKGESDEFEYEFEIEWGVAEDHELIFEVPVELGDGAVDGNGDLEVGWHWRLWRESDWMPAFAMRNFLRLPTGYHSSGVDYEWIGLFTKSIIPGRLRFDANPFIKFVNGDNEQDARDFLWGGSFGLDWRANDDLVLVALYRYETGELEGTRDNHYMQLGGEWDIDEHSEIGFSATVGLDGDDSGPAFGANVSYIYSF